MADQALDRKSDEELLALWQSEPSKGEECCKVIFERHSRGTCRFFLQLTQSEELSEDLNQTLYTELCSSYKSYSGKGRFIAWLFQIARNIFYDAVIRPNKHDMIQIKPRAFARLENVKDTSSKHADRRFEKTQRLEHFLRCYRRLPLIEKLIVMEHYFQGVPVKNLTKRLGLKNPSGARKYKIRALRHLQAALDEFSVKPKQRSR